MDAVDATRLSGDAYSTRLARPELPRSADKTRLAQEGYESRLAREAADVQPGANEFHKIGEKIGGRYEVSAIHHGAMGVVYGCFDHITKLPRALKTVRARYANDKQVLSMFEAEAAVWVSLEKHPYLVRAYVVERFANLPYVITEYVRGPEGMEGDLRGWLGHPRLTLAVAVTMALQIAQGMQHAVHKVPNLVHRDLKPANILVNGDGKAMVTDFGLVQAADSGAGTPAYMSPEQWRGEELDMRSDIYAFGCILFEMFTAHRLFAAETENEWEIAHLQHLPVAIASSVNELPSEIDQFLCRCLEKEKSARPQNWDEIVVFFAKWYHQLTGNSIVFDFSSLAMDAAELITASYSLSNLNRYQEMMTVCERSIAADPNRADSWNNMGAALMNLNRYEQAIEAFDQALTVDKNWLKAARNKCSVFLSLKRFEEMLIASKRAIAISNDSPEEWHNNSVALFELRRYEEALNASDHALAIDSEYLSAWVSKGNALGGLKQYEEAIKAYDHVLASTPLDFFACHNKADALSKLGRYEEATQSYDRAIAINPHIFNSHYDKGNALFNLDRYAEAIKAYDQAIKISPMNFSACYNKGVALMGLQRHEEAIQVFDRAIAIDRCSFNAWFNKGNAMFKLKRYEDAIPAYDQALAIDPKCLSAWNDKGGVLLSLSRFGEAIQAFDSALAIDPNSSPTWCNRGVAFKELRRYVEAIQSFDNALLIDPENIAARAGKFAAQSNSLQFGSALAVSKSNSYLSRFLRK